MSRLLKAIALLALLVGLPAPSFAAFSYYSTFTVNSSQVPSTQTDYTMLLLPTDNRFRTVGNGGHVTSSSGYDIRPYSDACITAITAYELVPNTYNASTGFFEMHVKLGSISTGTVVYLCYGNSSLTTDGSSNTAWNSHFKLVMHLSGSTPSGTDSTSNGNNFTNNGTTTAAGVVNGSAYGNGTATQYFSSNAGLTIPTGAGQLSMWWKPAVDPPTPRNLFLVNNDAGSIFQLNPETDGHFRAGWVKPGDDDRANWTETGISTGTWYYVEVVWENGGNTALAVDLATKQNTPTLTATWNTASITATILRYSPTVSSYGNNTVDEIRLYDQAPGIDWRTTTYNNQVAPGSFYTIGTESPVPPPSGSLPFSFIAQRIMRGVYERISPANYLLESLDSIKNSLRALGFFR